MKNILIILFALASFTFSLAADELTNQDMSYSISYPDYDKFVSFVKDANLSESDLSDMYQNCDFDPKAALVCAMAYDYGYHKVNKKIEKWYLFAADSDVRYEGKSGKYEYADYMSRIGKSGKVDKFFKPGECFTRRNKGVCFYYLGMARYNKNHNDCRYLHQAARYGVKQNLIKRICDK